jgi:hypothetical protein
MFSPLLAFLPFWRPGGVGVLPVAFFPAVAGVFAVADIPADPGVPILAAYILYCAVDTVQSKILGSGYWNVTFLCYRTIGISDIGLANSKSYRTIGYPNLSEYWISQNHNKLSVAQLCRISI